MSTKIKTWLSARLTPDAYQAVQDEASEKGKTATAVLEEAVRFFLSDRVAKIKESRNAK